MRYVIERRVVKKNPNEFTSYSPNIKTADSQKDNIICESAHSILLDSDEDNQLKIKKFKPRNNSFKKHLFNHSNSTKNI